MLKKDFLNNEYVKKALFILSLVAGSGVIILILMKLSVIAGLIAGVCTWIVRVMTGFIGGFVLAYLLLPVVKGLQKLLMKTGFFSKRPGAARGLALAVTYLLILLVLVLVIFALALAITKKAQSFHYQDLPKLFAALEMQAVGMQDALLKGLESIGVATEGLRAWIDNIKNNMTESLPGIGNGFLVFANGVGSFFSNALFSVIFSIYFLLETEGLCTYWSNAFCALLGKKIHGVLAVLLKDADVCFAGYIRGQLADALFMTVAVGGVLTVIGVPYAVVIGILSGIGNLIPYVGPIVAYGTSVIVCIGTGRLSLLPVALIAIFVLQTVDGNVVNPKLLSTSIDVHPVLVIVGLLFGSAIGGIGGMLLAVPVASFFKIQFERLVRCRQGSGMLAENDPSQREGNAGSEKTGTADGNVV